MGGIAIKRGDYVEYNPGYGKKEYGRVTGLSSDGRAAFVCFTSGCTAAACNIPNLKVIEEPSDALISRGFGFHRFDDTCPDCNPDACYLYCPDKVAELELR